mmetsp:Transcript_1545/g.3488  ORF Transcript_1545/g.3488 Transcript_1545/m.3488 type:complete len:221 (-) Transcript_1545:1091-1753(-)
MSSAPARHQPHEHVVLGPGSRELLPLNLGGEQLQVVLAGHGSHQCLGLQNIERHAQAGVRAVAEGQQAGPVVGVGVQPALRLEALLDLVQVHVGGPHLTWCCACWPVGVQLQGVSCEGVKEEGAAYREAEAAHLELPLHTPELGLAGAVDAQRLPHTRVQVAASIQSLLAVLRPVLRHHRLLLLPDLVQHLGHLAQDGHQAVEAGAAGVGTGLQHSKGQA